MRFAFNPPVTVAISDEVQLDSQRKAELYQWILGQRSTGLPVFHPSAQIETQREQADLYEVARLIRGTGKSAE